MAKSYITLDTRIDAFKDEFNGLVNKVGDLATLTTTGDSDLVQAINEHSAELGTITAGAMGTTASTVSSAIAEHETQLGNVNINSIASGNNTITGALSQLHTELGSATLNTNATTHTGAINELELGLRGTSNNLVAADLSGMTATNIVSAILLTVKPVPVVPLVPCPAPNNPPGTSCPNVVPGPVPINPPGAVPNGPATVGVVSTP